MEDLNNDENKTVEETKDGYTLTSIVNYPNNKKLVKQKIMLDKNYEVKEVTVLDDSDNMQIKMVFNKIDLKSEFDDNYFKLKVSKKRPDDYMLYIFKHPFYQTLYYIE